MSLANLPLATHFRLGMSYRVQSALNCCPAGTGQKAFPNVGSHRLAAIVPALYQWYNQ